MPESEGPQIRPDEESSREARRQIRENIRTSMARLRQEVQAEEDQRRRAEEALAALRERLGTNPQPGDSAEVNLSDYPQESSVADPEGTNPPYVMGESAIAAADMARRFRYDPDNPPPFPGGTPEENPCADGAFINDLLPGEQIVRNETAALAAERFYETLETRLAEHADQPHPAEYTEEQRRLLNSLSSEPITATGRNPVNPVQQNITYASGGRIRLDREALYNYASGNSWVTFDPGTIDIETTGGPMPRTAEFVPHVERLKSSLNARKAEVRENVRAALSHAETVVSNLREVQEYLNRSELNSSDFDECKYLVRHARDYLASAGRAVNPGPAAFTNMIRLTRDITNEQNRIQLERADALAEDRRERFAAALEAETEYVPATDDYLTIRSLSSWPLQVVSISPAVQDPENLGEATFVLRDRNGVNFTRSLTWLRLHEATQTTRDARPENADNTDNANDLSTYVPQVGDILNIPSGIFSDGEVLTHFVVDHVTEDTTVTDSQGRPNPMIRLATTRRPGTHWSRRLGRLRTNGYSVVQGGTEEFRLVPGDRFRVSQADWYVDAATTSSTVFVVDEVTPAPTSRHSEEVWFSVEGGNGYRFLRTMQDLRNYTVDVISRASDAIYFPEVGDVVSFSEGATSLTYNITRVDRAGDESHTRVHFYSNTDTRVPPHEYSYALDELRSIHMTRVS